jgi:molybdopterin molybdotransferase
MHTPAEAARHMVAAVRALPPQRRPLRDALSYVLAEPVTSPLDLPPWDNSGMDGYAVRAADVAAAGATLRVVESVAAGAFPTRPLGPGEATRIFTGAPLPGGADTVIRQEDTEVAGDRVTIRDVRDRGRNVRHRGEDIGRGSTVLAAGTALGPAQLGVLASIAHAQPLVHPAPRVAFFGSGDEIADLDESDAVLAGKKIASSNSYTLHASIRAAGAVPVDVGLARDTRESLAARFSAAQGADLIVTTAGVSVGEHDLVRDVVQDLGGEIALWRVRMRPGAPLGFGTLFGVPWIGLPGNPVSTMVTFELFVRPVIRRLMGHPLPFRRTVAVELAERVTLGPKLRHYLRAVVGGSPFTARLTGPQGSGILTSMARANALLIVPEDRPEVAAGELLDALLLDDHHHVAEPPF